MECKNEEEGRNKLKDELGRLWMEESRKVGDLPFDLRLILALFSFNKITLKFFLIFFDAIEKKN